VLLLATYPLFVINCGDGMETPLFMLLMVELARAMLAPVSRASGIRVGLLTAAMILTRPESLPLLLALPLVHGYARRADGQPAGSDEWKAWIIAFLVAGLLPVVLHEAWRWLYYGHPLPNTYYAKATGSQLVRLRRGYRDLLVFFYGSPWVTPVTVWLSLLLAGFSQRMLVRLGGASARRWAGVLWLMLLFRVSFDLWSGSEAMGHSRFNTPMLIPLVIIADEGVRALRNGVARFLIVLLFVVALGFNVVGNGDHVAKVWSYREGLERGHIALGRWLRERYPEDGLIAMGDAGTAPFFSRMRTIDLWGLNDAVIAHMPGEYGARQGVGDYALSRDPDIVVIWNRGPFYEDGVARIRGATSFDRQIANHPEFKLRYRFVRDFIFAERVGRGKGYYLSVFERRKVERPESEPDEVSGEYERVEPDRRVHFVSAHLRGGRLPSVRFDQGSLQPWGSGAGRSWKTHSSGIRRRRWRPGYPATGTPGRTSSLRMRPMSSISSAGSGAARRFGAGSRRPWQRAPTTR